MTVSAAPAARIHRDSIFYVTWLHDDMDSDHVAPAAEVAVERAAVESLAEGARG